jgi:hypothetical protein
MRIKETGPSYNYALPVRINTKYFIKDVKLKMFYGGVEK